MGTVTDVKYWKCPSCGQILEKGMLEKGIVQPGEPADRIIGTGTCSGCGTGHAQSAIYGGEYDFAGDQPTDEVPSDRVPTVVSVVLFREGSEPPSSERCTQACASRVRFPTTDTRRISLKARLPMGITSPRWSSGTSSRGRRAASEPPSGVGRAAPSTWSIWATKL